MNGAGPPHFGGLGSHFTAVPHCSTLRTRRGSWTLSEWGEDCVALAHAEHQGSVYRKADKTIMRSTFSALMHFPGFVDIIRQ